MRDRFAFSFAALHVHLQPSINGTFPIEDEVPADMQAVLARLQRQADLSVSERLGRLKRLFDENTRDMP